MSQSITSVVHSSSLFVVTGRNYILAGIIVRWPFVTWGPQQAFSQVMCLVGTCHTLHFWWALCFNVPCSSLIPPVFGLGKHLAHWISRVRSSRNVKHSAFVGTYPLLDWSSCQSMNLDSFSIGTFLNSQRISVRKQLALFPMFGIVTGNSFFCMLPFPAPWQPMF